MYICAKCEDAIKAQGGFVDGLFHSMGSCEICNESGSCLDARNYRFNQRDIQDVRNLKP